MEAAGFTNIQRFEAIDGHFTDESVFENLKILKGGPGQRRCSASHLLLWKQFLENSDKEFLFVAEDDMIPHSDFNRLFPLYWNETPKSFDIILVGSKIPHITDQDPMIFKSLGWCTHAYIISKQGAKTLLGLFENGPKNEDSDYVIDIFLAKLMGDDKISYFSYNGKKFLDEKNRDGIYQDRDSGICFQNRRLGTTIHSAEIIYE